SKRDWSSDVCSSDLRFDQFQLPTCGGIVECGQTEAIGCIRVRSFFQKENHQRFVSCSARDQQRASAVGCRRTDIRARGREGTSGIEIALLNGEEEWRQAGLRLRLHVGAMFDEVSRNRGVLLSDGPYQGRLRSATFPCIHVGS